ncbi:MAG: prepilin-type N-terminal cleavage/methylation domain-containing protein [Chromatiales bacterium]|nr:prepilin-type N-terminal cleavage/methylation domain-containing protein [Chromatiales bacterium]
MSSERGFTLIEAVIFIVIVGIAVTGMLLMFSKSAENSHSPLIRQKAIAVASAYMDEILGKRWDENTPLGGGCVITGAGNCSSNWITATSYAIGNIVVPTSSNGHKYRVLVAGVSGGSEPAWPTDGSSLTDGTVTWEDLGDHTATSNCGASPSNCGPDGENRSTYDDLDDFNGLTDNPPQYPDSAAADGDSPMPGYNGFNIQVSVTAQVWQGVPANDVRRIVVTVTTPMSENFELTAYRLNL